jgi:hypothetical protein
MILLKPGPMEREYIFSISMDCGYSGQQIINELEKPDNFWEVEVPGGQPVNQNRDFGKRWVLGGRRGALEPNIENPVLSSIVKQAMSEDFKLQIIQQLYASNTFGRLWGMRPELMISLSRSWASFVKDYPGTTVKLHLDNRSLIATGMIYFVEGDNPEMSTTFYTDDKRSNPQRIKTGMCQGWLAANTHDSWHEGYNTIIGNEADAKIRYSLLLGLQIGKH